MIFQQPSLYPWLSALDNVAFGLKLRGVGRKERRECAEQFLRQIGLREFAHKHPDELSGGCSNATSSASILAAIGRCLSIAYAQRSEVTKAFQEQELAEMLDTRIK